MYQLLVKLITGVDVETRDSSNQVSNTCEYVDDTLEEHSRETAIEKDKQHLMHIPINVRKL